MLLRPLHSKVRLAICYKNFARIQGISHIGLGVAATQNAKALRAAGYIVEIWPIMDVAELAKRLTEDRAAAAISTHVPLSHVVISAPWLPTAGLAPLIHLYSDIEFVVVSHSNIGFLQADPQAILLLRQGAELAQSAANFRVAGNSSEFQTWWRATYQSPLSLLPNMYPFSGVLHRPAWSGGRLRMGCFCAIRPYKNVLTAAAAALETGVRLRSSDLEFWVSSGRNEGGNSIVQAIEQMYANVPRAKFVQQAWQSWPQFLATVGAMDLLLQPSYTETFNMVTADGIARGVASVVGDAIGWAPKNWTASTDSASDIADRAVALLHDPGAIDSGVKALMAHNVAALVDWEEFLTLRA